MSGSQCAFASVFFSADGGTGWVTSVICSKHGQAPRSPARNQSRCSFTRAMCSLDMESKSFILKRIIHSCFPCPTAAASGTSLPRCSSLFVPGDADYPACCRCRAQSFRIAGPLGRRSDVFFVLCFLGLVGASAMLLQSGRAVSCPVSPRFGL